MSTDGSSQSLTAGQKRKLRDRERLILAGRPKGASAKSWAQLLNERDRRRLARLKGAR
jgi:hypothetical protein